MCLYCHRMPEVLSVHVQCNSGQPTNVIVDNANVFYKALEYTHNYTHTANALFQQIYKY